MTHLQFQSVKIIFFRKKYIIVLVSVYINVCILIYKNLTNFSEYYEILCLQMCHMWPSIMQILLIVPKWKLLKMIQNL